jgi:NADH:ubiquinone oxidoreductase subunit 6 (subunit J)
VSVVTFAVLAVIALGSALGLVFRKNAIHGALFLVVNLGTVAALYLSLGAEFLAAAQVIVYAGAIMVLFVFAIMVLIPGKEETGPDPRRPFRLLAPTPRRRRRSPAAWRRSAGSCSPTTCFPSS